MPTSRIRKRGNSQGLRLSRRVLELAKIGVGDDVEIVVRKHEILIRKLSRPKYDLAEMVKLIPKGYQAGEVEWGRPVGKEDLW